MQFTNLHLHFVPFQEILNTRIPDTILSLLPCLG